MHLLDFTDREFRRKPGGRGSGLEDGPTVRQSISPPCGNFEDGEPLPDIVEGAMDCRDNEDLPAVGHNIPQWLQRDEEYDAVDWLKVARHVARKPRMIPALAKALTQRAAGFSRPRSVTMAASKEEAREIEAAWRWIDREWQRTIVPLFLHEQPPEEPADRRPTDAKRKQRSFIPPSEALKNILARRTPKPTGLMSGGPSLQVQRIEPRRDLSPRPSWQYRFEDGAGLRGLRPNAFAVWDGSTMILARTDSSDGLAIQAKTLNEALDLLRDEREHSDESALARLFLGPPNKAYSRRAGVYLVEPHSLDFSDPEEDTPESGTDSQVLA
ncbi:MAG: hypothetical protein LLG20_04105 [Acidobacteriales bacterium]|nr:hypothetical protein [Terriglobales bacterium]